MKQTKPYLLVLVSVFLIISIGLLSATVYLYFYKSNSNFAGIVSEHENKSLSKNNIAVSRDSLERIYSSAITSYDSSAYNVMPANFVDTAANSQQKNSRDSYLDSLNKKTQQHQSFDKLRTEIDQILLDKSPSADLNVAKIKINELKQLNEGLKNKNITIIKENDRLYSMVKQMSVSNSNPITTKPQYNLAPSLTNNATVTFNANNSTLKVDNIQLNAYKSTNFIDKETNNTEEADKMIGTVQLKNNGVKTAIAEVMVVVTQPNGKVLQNSNWESGVFNTNTGKKIYSNKLRFDNNFETTSKKINFALQADAYMPGNYTVELYQNGVLIAKTIKTFN